MSKVILRGYILVLPAERDQIKAALATHIQLTQAEPGCLVFSVVESAINECRFDVYEEFIDDAAFEFHQQRVQQSAWGALSKNVERCYQITRTAH